MKNLLFYKKSKRIANDPFLISSHSHVNIVPSCLEDKRMTPPGLYDLSFLLVVIEHMEPRTKNTFETKPTLWRKIKNIFKKWKRKLIN